ncbi:MAG TPA: arsenosugar biosynthesis radical SAM (seleno)protein ArsS [Candidatus Binatia bacterium]|nr:arsenosugar biosynthesis radical SAM (seleno)protein ArsS [Candidatus Binatia bacterium]
MHDFDATLREHGLGRLRRGVPDTLQVNVGKRCNQACHHCHVDAGPTRTEMMAAATAARVLALLAQSPGVGTLDLTGGAPELNPSFPELVAGARALDRRVVVRCNLTVLFVEGLAGLVDLYGRHAVELICSLPCYTAENVDRQRGGGVFARSVEALRRLNAAGYGLPGSPLRLDLVYNPVGAFLPPPQAALEARYREELRRAHGIEFHHLLTLTNMPIRRFAEQLRRAGEEAAYLGLLVNHFNPATVPGLMCRSLVSVGWDGALYDCDFNQMLERPLADGSGPRTIWDVGDLAALGTLPVATGAHCFGCTAGGGSSCGGALV